MRRFRLILPLALLFFCCFFCGGAFAQSLNQTVTVTNQYAGHMADFEMGTLKTRIPDSLYRFDLDFNYTGFEIKYEGNDSFNPIHTQLDMPPRAYDGRRFSMTAAVGYAFPMAVDMNAVLKQNGRFKLGFFASNDSFWGRYDRILPDGGGVLYPDGVTFEGFDSRTRIGFDSRWDWRRSRLLLNVKYDGIHSSVNDMGRKNMYNCATLDGSYRLRSDGCFRLGVDASYTFGGYEGGTRTSPLTLMENIYDVDLTFTFAIAKVHMIDIEASFNMTDAFGANVKGAAFGGYNVLVSPMYWFSGSDKLFFGLGLSLLYSGSVANVDTGTSLTGFPRLKLRWKALRDYMVVYADASLDGEVWGAGSNSRQNVFYVEDAQKSIVKNYKSDIGLRGNIAGKLHYDVYAGYSNVQNAPLCAVSMSGACGCPVTYVVHEKNLRSVSAGAQLWAKAGPFTFSADMLYRYFIGAEQMTALPSWMTAGGDVKYEYRTRFYLHAGAAYKSDCKAGDYKTPGYVDLKAGAGYNFRRSWGLFIEGSNLLNYSCQDVPLYSRSGPEVVIGIRLLY